MEDLDALLADLQNTTAQISSFQNNERQPQQQQQQQQQYHRDHHPIAHQLPGNPSHPRHDHHEFNNHRVSDQADQGGIYQLQQRVDHSPTSQTHSVFDYPHNRDTASVSVYPRSKDFTDSSDYGRDFADLSDYPLRDCVDLNDYPHRDCAGLNDYPHRDSSDSRDYPHGRDFANSRDYQQSRDSTAARTQHLGYPEQIIRVSVSGESYNSSGGTSGGSTPPPLPPPPPSDILDNLAFNRDFEHPGVYDPQQGFHARDTTSPSSHPNDHVVVQHRAQVNRDRGERMSALSNNLSELDQLLQDLNSAQFMAEVDRKSGNSKSVITFLNYLEDQSDGNRVNEVTVNGGVGKRPPPIAPKHSGNPGQRGSVDNLLDQLEGVGSQPGRFPVDPNYQELNPIPTNHSYHQQHNQQQQQQYYQHQQGSANPGYFSGASYYPQQQNASTATKELDELMMSLSEFKMQNKGDNDANEPTYAKPVKSISISSSSPTSPPGMGPGYNHIVDHRQQHFPQQQQQRENGLDVMLGDLQYDMNRQGVNVKQKGVCSACQKPIVGQVIAALGRTWHVEHFVCAHCDEPLGTRNFYERDSLAYCETDYHHLFAPRCAYCNGPIVDKCITALEKMWHPEHFFCAQCGRPFGDEDFHEKNGKAYCREDYFQMFAPKCGGCAQPIMENYISALNRQWHPECFVCWECRSTFGGGSFFDFEGLPYCETHYHARKGSLCASCERPITGRCITAMFKKFHPEHFVCAFCLKQLNKGTFKEQNDKPYCHPCFVKLFG